MELRVQIGSFCEVGSRARVRDGISTGATGFRRDNRICPGVRVKGMIFVRGVR